MPPNATPHATDTVRSSLNLTTWEGVTPGAFVEIKTGHLYRIPDDAVKAGRSPVLDIVARDQLQFVQISPDPFIVINKARMVCADLDIAVNF